MRIVIDLQGAQTGTLLNDGVCYPRDLALAIARHRGDHDVIIVLSDLFPETICELRGVFHDVLPHSAIRVWSAEGPVAGSDPENDARRGRAELIREAFLASLAPDVVLVTSLFEGFEKDAVISIGRLVNVPTAVVLYDFLPFQQRDASLQDSHLSAWYTEKTEQLKRADQLLAVSPSIAQEIVSYWPQDSHKVTNISMAPDPMFEPMSVPARDADEVSRREQDAHGSQRSHKLIWDSTVKEVFTVLCNLRDWHKVRAKPVSCDGEKPRLAFVSPLPPERTGIANYNAELLPVLAEYYRIDVITDQPSISDDRIKSDLWIRDIDWFRRNAADFDRVIYHVGNSKFHGHMFDLLQEVPGVVVLHDFFLSDIQLFLNRENWQRSLLLSHGIRAVAGSLRPAGVKETVKKYPANLPLLQSSVGVIAHNECARRLAHRFYGPAAGKDWAIVPLLRAPEHEGVAARHQAKAELGLPSDSTLFCSFGLIGPSKLNADLVRAFLGSSLANDPAVHLVLVGENEKGDYGKALWNQIENSGLGSRVRITGWADPEVFKTYLQAADVGVQLRTGSGGETSATVLDCMAHGLPTIVNANGSLADIDPSAVSMVPDAFEDADLIQALERLATDLDYRERLGTRACALVETQHEPAFCARAYRDAIEEAYSSPKAAIQELVDLLASGSLKNESMKPLAESLAWNFPPSPRKPALFVDVSIVADQDIKTGVQRVVRAVAAELLEVGDLDFDIILVRRNVEGRYVIADELGGAIFDVDMYFSTEPPIDPVMGDFFIGLDLDGGRPPTACEEIKRMQRRGVKIYHVVYDLLPLQLPHYFPEEEGPVFSKWFDMITSYDGAICISQTVAEELRARIAAHPENRQVPFDISWFHLGADIQSSVPSRGLPAESKSVLAQLQDRPTFLMVGTVEPRKGHRQVLAAFNRLWERGVNVNLMIVGKEGWLIADLVQQLREHPELGNRLFWPDFVSDEYLEQIYAASTCLVAASEGEGFGLPLIEAAQHGLPILARDISVFREVAGDFASYFSGLTPDELADAVEDWLEDWRLGHHTCSDGMPWRTWEQSTAQLLAVIEERMGDAA